MELQKSLPDFEREGVVVFAISYDPVSVLAAFASKYGITYTLLSDEGSRVIRDLGLLNRHLAEQHAYYGVAVREHHHGVPYPGVFGLDENGIIVEKRFEQSYRVRPTTVSILESAFAGESSIAPVTARGQTDEIVVDFWLGTPTYRPYQKLQLDFEVRIAPGLHVYGLPVPGDYTPLTIEVERLEGMELGPLSLPEPRSLRLEGLDEQFYIYDGTVRGSMPIVLTKNLGDVTLKPKLRYQACTDSFCYPPDEVMAELRIAGVDVIRD